ncbi:uncharacterized protein LOC131248713 [Magnolia sinica]|uniref:uncharacterized protein LOC131248713 n=1 Tax=Magnolia sinica TaxID=86752 RepID=UPI00265907C8|nr:uncharacterized protein LOC131248713 [Magnolia sinica]
MEFQMELLSVAPQLPHPNSVPMPTTESQPPLTDVITALEQATQTVKSLPSSTDPAHLLQAYASLRNAHHQIGAVLARFLPHHQTVENSSVSVAGCEEDEPMADENSEEVESLKVIEKVEEGMRDCALDQRKRRKRPLSPYWATQRPANDCVRDTALFDQRERLRSFDLVFQFHG